VTNCISRENYFQVAFVLTRVLNTGVIMSIERNEQELKGLQKVLKRVSGRNFVNLYNSYTGAIHGAAVGNNLVYGEQIGVFDDDDSIHKFIRWLGLIENANLEVPFVVVKMDWNQISTIEDIFTSYSDAGTIIVDFTSLNFGPCAAVLTNDESVYNRGERLKIFGAFDLRTMWTQKDEYTDSESGVQFNYRLSPLVAACVKLAIIRGQVHEK